MIVSAPLYWGAGSLETSAIAEKSDAQTAKSSSQDVNAADAGSNNKAQSVNGADKNELNDKVNEAVHFCYIKFFNKFFSIFNSRI